MNPLKPTERLPVVFIQYKYRNAQWGQLENPRLGSQSKNLRAESSVEFLAKIRVVMGYGYIHTHCKKSLEVAMCPTYI